MRSHKAAIKSYNGYNRVTVEFARSSTIVAVQRNWLLPCKRLPTVLSISRAGVRRYKNVIVPAVNDF